MLTGQPERRLDLGFPGTGETLSTSLAKRKLFSWFPFRQVFAGLRDEPQGLCVDLIFLGGDFSQSRLHFLEAPLLDALVLSRPPQPASSDCCQVRLHFLQASILAFVHRTLRPFSMKDRDRQDHVGPPLVQ